MTEEQRKLLDEMTYTAHLQERFAALEAENARLRALLEEAEPHIAALADLSPAAPGYARIRDAIQAVVGKWSDPPDDAALTPPRDQPPA